MSTGLKRDFRSLATLILLVNGDEMYLFILIFYNLLIFYAIKTKHTNTALYCIMSSYRLCF